MAELPSDVFFHIFSKMPVKSLARFRCVCKLWCKYIDDPYLAIIHYKLAMEEPMLLMHMGVCDNMPQIINFLHIRSKQELPTSFLMRLFSSLNVLSNEALEVRKNPNLEFSYNGYQPIDMVLGSCNGLLLLGSREDLSYDTNFVVIHPLRKELYELPPIKLGPLFPHTRNHLARNQVSCGLGFDTCINTFKVVSIVLRQEIWPLKPELDKEYVRAMVHVLGTNTWREIPQIPYYYMTKPGVFVHGWLHWLANYFQTIKVLFFDVKSEEFGFIDLPKKVGRFTGHVVFHNLVDLCGELGYAYDSINFAIEVWLLKNREWVMHCRIAHKPHLPNSCINVLGCWNKDGDILLTTKERRKQLFVYNLKSGILQKANWIDAHVEHIHMYRASLFSIHGACFIKY